MKRIFGQNFVYTVDCYEVWRDQKCIDQSDIDGQIFGIVYDQQMFFAYTGLEKTGFKKPFKINLTFSQTLEAKGNSLINEDRIQYLNDQFYSDDSPYICHLFCKYGRINYIRFAKAVDGSDILSPNADTIYEYYGDMMELGCFSEKSISGIDLICEQIIESSKSKGFTISLEESLNHNMVWNSMIETFKSELVSLFDSNHQLDISREMLLAFYTEKMVKEYFDAIGYISYFTFNHICEDVYKAAISICPLNNINNYCQLKFKVLFDLMIN